jgi:hypothetical protein
MANYLHAHPGFPQKIGDRIFTVKWMYSRKQDAQKRVVSVRNEGKYAEVRLYPRKINGRLFGRHPWCVCVFGRKKK